MKQDRFLTGILIGIAVLVVIALVVFFVRKDNLAYVADDNPAGVVQNYAVAIYKHDYEKAYSYLAELPNKPTLDQFEQAFFNHSVASANTALEIGKVEVNKDSALVDLSINNQPSGPFASEFRNTDYAQLVRQNGAWKIKQMPPYYFWAYDWYTPTPKP